MKDWRRVRLGDVCRVVGGTTPSSSVDEYWNGEIVWVTPTDLGALNGIYTSDSERHLTKAGYDSCGTEIVPPGTVVLSSRAPIGHLGIAAVPLCTNQGCKCFVPGEGVDSLFLYFALRNPVARLRALGSGATFTEVSKSLLESFEIGLPPLTEQRRIAARLTEQLAAVERARAAAVERVATAAALRGAQLRSALTTGESDGWPRRKLGEICHIQLGKMLSPKSKTGSQPKKYLRNANVQWDRLDLADVAAMDFTDAEAEKFALQRGDLLVCEGGEPGRSAVWQAHIEPCFYQKALHRLRPRVEGANPRFLMYRLWLGAASGEFSGSHAKTTIAHLPAVRLAELEVGLPPSETQSAIVRALDEGAEFCRQLESQVLSELAAVEALPAALLLDAFSAAM